MTENPKPHFKGEAMTENPKPKGETMNPIIEHLNAGTLIRHKWSGRDDRGRELACLYSALVPRAISTDDCPASLMPQWIA
ncbi:MAG: hypothetical protein ORO03_10450, partial [Alphaproteobacteria bacterium]|nr:hypothetical protein [Alphaproteobacteria bacterium]